MRHVFIPFAKHHVLYDFIMCEISVQLRIFFAKILICNFYFYYSNIENVSDDDLCLKFIYWRRIYCADLQLRDALPEDGAGSWRRFAGNRKKRIVIPYDVDDYVVNPFKWVGLAHGKFPTALSNYI